MTDQPGEADRQLVWRNALEGEAVRALEAVVRDVGDAEPEVDPAAVTRAGLRDSARADINRLTVTLGHR